MNDRLAWSWSRYFDGELPADRRAKVARLLAEDHEARAYWDRTGSAASASPAA